MRNYTLVIGRIVGNIRVSARAELFFADCSLLYFTLISR